MDFNNENSHATFRFLWRNFDYGYNLNTEERDDNPFSLTLLNFDSAVRLL